MKNSMATKEVKERIEMMKKDINACYSRIGLDAYNTLTNAKIALDNGDISNIEHQNIENETYKLTKEFDDKCICANRLPMKIINIREK